MIYFICNGVLGQPASQRNCCTHHDDILITSWLYDNYFQQTPISRASHWLTLTLVQRSLKFGPYITYIASKPKAHGVVT